MKAARPTSLPNRTVGIDVSHRIYQMPQWSTKAVDVPDEDNRDFLHRCMANCYGDLKRSDLRNPLQLSRSCGRPCETPRRLLYRLAPGVSDECQK